MNILLILLKHDGWRMRAEDQVLWSAMLARLRSISGLRRGDDNDDDETSDLLFL